MKLNGANILMDTREGRFDGHAHVFAKDLPMSSDRRYTPIGDALIEHYLSALKGERLDGGILVQPSFLGTDNSFLLDALLKLSSQENMTFKGVAVISPQISTEELQQLKNIIGIRLNLVGDIAKDRFHLHEWEVVFKVISDLGWHVEVHCEGRYLPQLLPDLLNCCDRIVVDHFGLPDPRQALSCPGLEMICGCISNKIFVKASAPYRVFPEMGSNEAAHCCSDIIKRLVESLGPDQLLWGSDWPWTQFENRHLYSETTQWERNWVQYAEV